MNIYQSCKMFLSPPASPVEIENKNKYLMRKPMKSVFEEITMYPRLTIPYIIIIPIKQFSTIVFPELSFKTSVFFKIIT